MSQQSSHQPSPHFSRSDALVVHCSGVNEPRYQIDAPLGRECTFAIDEALEDAEWLEILAITRDGYTEVVFADPDSHRSSTGASESRLISRLQTALASALPEWIGLTRGPYDLAPLGEAPLPTARVVRETGSTSTSLGRLLEGVIRYNMPRSRPTVCQLVVSQKRTDRFEAVMRVAADHSRSVPIGRHALRKTIADPPAGALRHVLPAGYHSSRELFESYWTTRPSPLRQTADTPVLHVTNPTRRPGNREALTELTHASPAARRTLSLLSGIRAYDNLLSARITSSSYRPLDVEPTLSVSTSTLASLLSVVPLYTGVCWSQSRTRSLPTYEVAERIRNPAGSTIDPRDAAASASSGSFCQWVSQWCSQLIDGVQQLEERARGYPHLRGSPSGTTAPVVVVDPDASQSDPAVETAGELIMVANRAVRNGEQLLVVTPSASAATWADKVLAVPYAGVQDDETVVYTVPEPVPHGDGGVVLTERANGTPTWTVQPDSTRRLVNEAGCLAEGPLSTPLEALAYTTPRLVNGESSVSVARSGRPLEPFRSLSSCLSTYQMVPQPVCPVWPTFRGHATVLYQDGHQLQPHHSATHWTPDGGIRTDLETALATFLDTYTVHRRGCGAARFGEVLDGWLHAQLDCQVPSRFVVTRRLPQNTTPKTNENGEIIGLHGREWRLPMLEYPLECANGGTDAA